MNTGSRPRWVDAYGDLGNLRYIAVWMSNNDNRTWNFDDVGDNYATMQSRFNALATGFTRPVQISASLDDCVLTVCDDSQMPNWQCWVGMPSSDYQSKFNTLYPQGLRPIRVSAKGTGSAARFSVNFSAQEDAGMRSLRVSCPACSAAVPAIDSAMEAVMSANMWRGASLAIVVARGWSTHEAILSQNRATRMGSRPRFSVRPAC